jgi:Icc-related predicted phosphoesterase
MLVCFTSDLHGQQSHYERLGDLLTAERPAVLILGGDLFADGSETSPVTDQLAELHERFLPRVRQWRSTLPNLSIACLPGNHDWATTAAALAGVADQEGLVVLPHATPVTLADVHVVGFPFTPWTPHYAKDFERRDLAADDPPEEGGLVSISPDQPPKSVSATYHFSRLPALDELFEQVPSIPDPWILVAHAPPFDTQLDQHPEVAYPIGSRAVRAFIEQRQPLIALHGHVHDSYEETGQYIDRLGQTLCVNPGQAEEKLHAVLFDTSDPAGTLRLELRE